MTPQTNTDKVKEETLEDKSKSYARFYTTGSINHELQLQSAYKAGAMWYETQSYTPSEVNLILEKLRERCADKYEGPAISFWQNEILSIDYSDLLNK